MRTACDKTASTTAIASGTHSSTSHGNCASGERVRRCEQSPTRLVASARIGAEAEPRTAGAGVDYMHRSTSQLWSVHAGLPQRSRAALAETAKPRTAKTDAAVLKPLAVRQGVCKVARAPVTLLQQESQSDVSTNQRAALHPPCPRCARCRSVIEPIESPQYHARSAVRACAPSLDRSQLASRRCNQRGCLWQRRRCCGNALRGERYRESARQSVPTMSCAALEPKCAKMSSDTTTALSADVHAACT